MKANTVNKRLYKIELYLLKILPMIIALVYMVNTVLSFFDINTIFFSMFGGTSILVLLFLYLSSYVFQFCEYHRIFLHYVVVNDMISLIDLQWGIPLSDFNYLCLHLLFIGICFFLALYFKIKNI